MTKKKVASREVMKEKVASKKGGRKNTHAKKPQYREWPKFLVIVGAEPHKTKQFHPILTAGRMFDWGHVPVDIGN